jgi:hypothetical protein
MTLRNRLRKLTDTLPRCQPGITRIVTSAEPPEADRCQRCGGRHTLFIQEVIVETHEEAQMWLAKNGECP